MCIKRLQAPNTAIFLCYCSLMKNSLNGDNLLYPYMSIDNFQAFKGLFGFKLHHQKLK